MATPAAATLRIRGPAIPFGRRNVDTDLILPSRYMRTVTRDGLGRGAFEALRADPDNVFDDPKYRGAPILIAGANFGCGSSREHAVWALRQIGIQAVVAPSFGEIFESNALRNGLLAIRLPEPVVERLLRLGPDDPLIIDVAGETLSTPDGGRYEFTLDPFRKHCLVHGLDDVAVTSGMETQIAAHEEQARRQRPWLFPSPSTKERNR